MMLTAIPVVLGWTTPAGAATVRCGGGDAACLVAAIHQANASGQDSTIRLAKGNYTLTAVDNNTDGNNGLPSVTGTLTIIGVGDAWNQTVIHRADGAPGFRIFHVAASGNLTLQGVAVANGRISAFGFPGGGGILNRGTLVMAQSALDQNSSDVGGGLSNLGGTVTIWQSHFFQNSAAHPGGGLYTDGGSVTIMQSTFAQNGGDGGGALEHVGEGDVTIVDSAITDNFTGQGGGSNISFYGGTLRLVNVTLARNTTFGPGAIISSGDVSLVNCTVVDNTASGSMATGGISAAGTFTLVNTILARNLTGPEPQRREDDCDGTLTSLGHNLIGDPTTCPIALQPTDLTGDPGLGAFTDNSHPGGSYYPPLPASQAVNAGDPQACPLKDQLGNPRRGTCDIGSIEFRGANVARR